VVREDCAAMAGHDKLNEALDQNTRVFAWDKRLNWYWGNQGAGMRLNDENASDGSRRG
jgi:hypothetical protein